MMESEGLLSKQLIASMEESRQDRARFLLEWMASQAGQENPESFAMAGEKPDWLKPTDSDILLRILMQEEWVLNDAETDECWYPTYAARLLGYLGEPQAIDSLLDTLILGQEQGGDYMLESLCYALRDIGLPAVEPMLERMRDAKVPFLARGELALTVTGMVEKLPETHDRVIAALEDSLHAYEENDATLNGMLVSGLISLGSTESIDLIRAAYEADCVALFICGTIEQVEYDLGLRTEPPPKKALLSNLDGLTGGLGGVQAARDRNRAKRKRKQKEKNMQKKKNRKKKR